MTDLSLRVAKDSPTLRERTTEKLRAAVLTQRLKPGERLVERDLCEQTGVSRTCVREALQHLESEGLIVRLANKGYIVASITPAEAREIYEVRAALERPMGRYFAERATDDDLGALLEAVKAASGAIEARSTRDYVAALDRFYEALLQGARNGTAYRLLKVLGARITYLRTLTSKRSTRQRERETVRLLTQIAESAARRDGEETAKRCEAFVWRSAEFALQVLEEAGS